MKNQNGISRRATLKGLGAAGALSLLSLSQTQAADKVATVSQRGRTRDIRKEIFDKVLATPLIDTHEHLIEEKERLKGTAGSRVICDDWAFLFSHYLDSDLLTAGMPKADYDRFFSPKVDPADKWRLIEPYWPAVKNTGYGLAVRLAAKALYGIDEIAAKTVRTLQMGYEKVRRPGFYGSILHERAKIESCQVNSLTGEPFKESASPTLLMQDINIVGMFAGPNMKQYAEPTGIEVASLADWHRVLDWWFQRYAAYAVAVKTQNAYSRDINYRRVPAEAAEPIFRKFLESRTVSSDERTQLEDHLFWYAVDKATAARLPVKMHTGYYAGQNYMPLDRLLNNPGSMTSLCRLAPDAKFVFMHICYPHYEEMLSVAKHYANAHVDMCWSWIINPVAAKDFLKKYLVTAPANKLLTFGGDYIPVELVAGHALMARRGIALALSELVEEGWLGLADALELVDPIMHNNARRIFRLDEKTAALRRAPWI